MKVLAIDTATEGCSVALLADGVLYRRFADVGRGHAETILTMVDETLREAGITLGGLDGIAASVGPGAFTGVRISVSVAQGLAFGADLPVVAVSTLEALALQALRSGTGRVLACLDARMGEVYWGTFSADPAQGLIQHATPAVGTAASVVQAVAAAVANLAGTEDAATRDTPWLGIGRGFAAYPVLGSIPGLRLAPGAAAALPDAQDMATLGAIRLVAGMGRDAAELTPQYLRDKVAFTEAERAAAKAGS